MIPLKKFLSYLDTGIIPDSPPIIPDSPPLYTSRYGRGLNYPIAVYQARKEATQRGMWAIVDKLWTKQLADWIGDRWVLEVMAGAGWLAKALMQHGIKVIATDSGEWNEMPHDKMKFVFPVQQIDGLTAVRKWTHASDVLIISWPPYGDMDICEICHQWGSEKPIVYIGEGEGGCNAPDEFWRNFRYEETEIPLMAWPGLHDGVFIGHYYSETFLEF